VKVAGSIYNGKDFTAIALYNSYPDIYSALPPGLSGRHEKHVKYSFNNKQSSLDIYSIEPSSVDRIKGVINLKNIFNTHKKIDIEGITARQNIRIESREELRDTQKFKDLQQMSVRDIGEFCREPASKPNTENPIIYVPKIVPITAVRYVNVKKPVTSGKSDYVDCKLEANVDFEMAKGECVSAFPPMTGLIDSETPTFTGDKFIGFYHDKSGDCGYCYAAHHHLDPYPKTFVNIDPEQLYDILMHGNFTNYDDELFGKHVDVLRLGKRTEAGATYHRKQLVDLIEICIRAGTNIVIPTKYLEFDPQIVDLCYKAKANDVKIMILHSITHLDDLERGPLLHGCDNKFRIEQNRLYAEAGVDASLYLMTELVYDTRQEHLDTIQYALDQGLTLQLLGARITKKNVAERITGRTWEQLKGKLRMEPYMHDGQMRMIQCGGYDLTGNTQLSPQVISPELLKLVDKNQGQVRLCHHTKAKEYCGACFLSKGFIKNFKEKKTSNPKRYIHYANKRSDEPTPTLEGFGGDSDAT